MSDLVLPPWAGTLRDRYLSGEASLFLLHGNVRDLQPFKRHHDLATVEHAAP